MEQEQQQQQSLPSSTTSSSYAVIPLQVPCVYYDSNFISFNDATTYYNELLQTIPWETSAKINRYVYLCQDQQQQQPSSTTTTTTTTTADMTQEKELNHVLDVPSSTQPTKSYTYRDAPTTYQNIKHKDDNNNSNNDETTTPDFPTIVRLIGQRVDEWYNYHRSSFNNTTTTNNNEKSEHDNDDEHKVKSTNHNNDTTTSTTTIQPTTTSNNKNNNNRYIHFNICLLNYYENGLQRIGWHSDREEIGRTTPVISISFGIERTFYIRSKQNSLYDRTTIVLHSGSLLCMENIFQHFYVHSIPKENHITTGRINLTFRCKQYDNETTIGEIINERHNHWLHEMIQQEQQQHEQDDEGVEGFSDNNVTAKSRSCTTNGWSLRTSQQRQHHMNRKSNAHDNFILENCTTPIITNTNDICFGDDVLSNINVSKELIIYIIKTNLGTECYCAAEINEILHDIIYNENENTNALQSLEPMRKYTVIAKPCNLDGYVGICHPYDVNINDNDTVNERFQVQRQMLESNLLQMRSAHHVLLYHDHFHLSECRACSTTSDSLDNNNNSSNQLPNDSYKDIDGECIYRYCKDRLVAGTLNITTLASINTNDNNNEHTEVSSFRVTCERIGTAHAFSSAEIEREIGGALSEYYTNCIPKMEDYDIHIRADVVGTSIIIGTQLNVYDLSKERHFLRYRNAVTLKTNIAYVMIRCANINKGVRVLDPFCGSGTLLLEALDMYDKQLSCIGLDVSKRSVEGSRKNAEAEQCNSDICQFVCADARSLRRHVPDNSIDAIISNLPWGVMTGHKNVNDLQTMYEVFLRNAWYVLKANARIVMFVLRGLQVTRIIRKLSGRYRLLSVNVVRTANNLPCIIVIEKLVTDEIRDSIKGQLMHLNQFVNVSPEIYNAIHTETIDES